MAAEREPLAVGFKVPAQQRLLYRIAPEANHFLTAESMGGQLTALSKLLRALAKEDKQKIKVLVARIATLENGEIEFELLIAGPADPDAGLPTAADVRGILRDPSEALQSNENTVTQETK